MCILSCFKERFHMIANFIDMSIYRYIGEIFLWIYRYDRYAKWRINDSTTYNADSIRDLTSLGWTFTEGVVFTLFAVPYLNCAAMRQSSA